MGALFGNSPSKKHTPRVKLWFGKDTLVQVNFRSLRRMDPRSSQLPEEFLALSNLISENPATFASGSNEVQLAALEATKFVFDLGGYSCEVSTLSPYFLTVLCSSEI